MYVSKNFHLKMVRAGSRFQTRRYRRGRAVCDGTLLLLSLPPSCSLSLSLSLSLAFALSLSLFLSLSHPSTQNSQP